MKMNKKGFTLIELLAVIVILAVIALIAVPRIIELLNNARKSAAEDSAYGILEAAESYMATYMLDNHGDFPGTITFTCSKENGCKSTEPEATLTFKGTKPTAGTIEVTASGGAKIGDTALTINGFSCTQSDEKNPDIITCTASAS